MRLRAIITAPTAMRAKGIATKISGRLINQSNPSTEAKIPATIKNGRNSNSKSRSPNMIMPMPMLMPRLKVASAPLMTRF